MSRKSSHSVLIRIILFSLCLLSLSACGDHHIVQMFSKKTNPKPISSKSNQQKLKPTRYIKLNIYLDLETRQALVQEHWNRPVLSPLLPQRSNNLAVELNRPLLSSALIENGFLIQLEQRLNEEYSPLGLRVSLNSVQAWESSLNGRSLGLDNLAHTLRSKFDLRPQSQNDLSKTDYTINVGLITSPLPSFAQLSDLIWARGGVPVVIVNRPLFYYLNDQSAAHTATSRLLIRGIAESLEIAPVCDGGWGGAKRDQLLGFKLAPLAIATPQSMPTNLSRDPYLRGTPLQNDYEKDLNDNSSSDSWTFQEMKWSSSSKALLQHYNRQSKFQTAPNYHCKRFELLHSSCSSAARNTTHQKTILSNSLTPLLKTSGDLCMSKKDYLIEQYQKGYLNFPQWKAYRITAQGFVSLQDGKADLALKYCQAIANHHPQLLASKCAGKAALELKNYSLASLYLRAYLSSHPNEVDSLYLLAKSLGHEGKDEEALAILKRLAKRSRSELKNKRNKILFNLGIAEARLGHYQNATRAWSKLDPSSNEAVEASALIKKLESQPR